MIFFVSAFRKVCSAFVRWCLMFYFVQYFILSRLRKRGLSDLFIYSLNKLMRQSPSFQFQLITRLENEIHKTEVQWNEAEHIRKKYRSIKNSLMMDSERFESTLLKMEAAIREQQQEINKLEAVFQEALQMRDSTKSVLSKQEQTTIASNKARERQAAEFRRQVEERKAELERLERKIFATGTKIIHQESGASSGKIDDEDALMRDNKATMEANFKKLMAATGVTVSNELVDRFLAQREASARLTYLRNVTEHEKKRLESQREQMTQQLDVFKFSDNRESEV